MPEDIKFEKVSLSARQFLIYWVTQLQMHVTQQATDADQPLFMVKGYDGDDEQFTEIDIFTDNPENLFDGTWTHPQLWRGLVM